MARVDQALNEDQKLQKSRLQAANRQRKKRNGDKRFSRHLGIAIRCMPERHPPFNAPEGTVSRQMAEYIQNVQANDCVARPQNWAEILYRKPKPQYLSHEPASQHPWHNLRCNHYCVAATNGDLQNYFRSGLSLPIVIQPESDLGQEITRGSPWFGQPLETILDEILKNGKAKIQVQDHAKANIGAFTVSKTCEEVRDRFRMNLQQRGCPCNCLEIDNHLPGHESPKLLERGARLQDWQFTVRSSADTGRAEWSAIPGAKRLDKWLLVSEKNSTSTAHVDVALATYFSCLVGKKTIWFRNNLTTIDQEVWDNLDVSDDHRVFEEPWARIDMAKGWTIVFPPGTIHIVFTEEDSVFCGGHFLIPQLMDRFLQVLMQLEKDPAKTNDFKSADVFRLLENFISEALENSSAGLTRAQLPRFMIILEKYAHEQLVTTKGLGDLDHRAEKAHRVRRTKFIKYLAQHKCLEKLKEKVEDMDL